MSSLNPFPILTQYPQRDRPVGPLTALANAGGTSGSELWTYRSVQGMDLVVRAWPTQQSSLTRVNQVHTWMDIAHELDYIPRIERTVHDISVIESQGRCWDLTTWMPGEPVRDRALSADLVETVFASLARLHLVWARAGTLLEVSPGLRSRGQEIAWLIAGGLVTLKQAIISIDSSSRHVMALAWVESAQGLGLEDFIPRDLELLPLQPSLRDARPDHFLFTGDRLTGLIDYGAMDIESVVADLSRLMLEWFDNDQTWHVHGLTAYERIRPLSDPERRALKVFARTSRLLAGARWIRWAFLEGRSFDDPQAVDRGLSTALGRIHNLIKR